MLTNKERNIVVDSMRQYPAGIDVWSWGESAEFFNDEGNPKSSADDIELLSDAVLLESG